MICECGKWMDYDRGGQCWVCPECGEEMPYNETDEEME